jgi:hypothetical protein
MNDWSETVTTLAMQAELLAVNPMVRRCTSMAATGVCAGIFVLGMLALFPGPAPATKIGANGVRVLVSAGEDDSTATPDDEDMNALNVILGHGKEEFEFGEVVDDEFYHNLKQIKQEKAAAAAAAAGEGSAVAARPSSSGKSTKACSACHSALEKSAYSKKQWKAEDGARRCKSCTAAGTSSSLAPPKPSGAAATKEAAKEADEKEEEKGEEEQSGPPPVGGDIKFEVDLNDEQRTKLKRFFMLSDDQIDVALYYTRRGKKIPDPAAYTIAKRCDSMILYLLIALLIFVAYAEYSINVLDEAERFLPSEVGVVRQALAKASQLVGYFWG